jgi:hypothetical protein
VRVPVCSGFEVEGDVSRRRADRSRSRWFFEQQRSHDATHPALLHRTIAVNGPADVVFRRAADLERYPDLVPGVDAVRRRHGRLVHATMWQDDHERDLDLIVVVHDRRRRIVMRPLGRGDLRLVVDVAPLGSERSVVSVVLSSSQSHDTSGAADTIDAALHALARLIEHHDVRSSTDSESSVPDT